MSTMIVDIAVCLLGITIVVVEDSGTIDFVVVVEDILIHVTRCPTSRINFMPIEVLINVNHSTC